MAGDNVTLPMLEAYIARRDRRVLAFPPAIEAVYDEQMASYRLKVMARGILPAVIIYNTFLIADALLLPQTLVLASAIHLAFVTPIIFLVGLLYPKARQHWFREAGATLIPFMMVAQIMFIYAINRGDAADHYQYLAVPVVVYMNVNLRFGFRLAVVSTLLVTGTYLAVLSLGHSPFEVKFIGMSLMVSAGYLSLIANRRMERDVRHAFLRRLRDQLLRESAEAVARQDALTGLANRRRLEETVDGLKAQVGEPVTSAAVIMVDIDHFKPFNDCYGHVAGDVCIKRVAGALAAECRNDSDLAVRLGGEEFLMLMPGTDMGEAVRVAERIRRHIEGLGIPHERLGPRGVVTVSLGAMAGPVSGEGFSELVTGGDAALYAAKRNGRNQVWPPFVRKGGTVVRLHDTQPAEKAGDGRG